MEKINFIKPKTDEFGDIIETPIKETLEKLDGNKPITFIASCIEFFDGPSFKFKINNEFKPTESLIDAITPNDILKLIQTQDIVIPIDDPDEEISIDFLIDDSCQIYSLEENILLITTFICQG